MRSSFMRRRWGPSLVGLITVVVAILFSISGAAGKAVRVHGRNEPTCPRYPSTRDPSNPLMLPTAPGSNPLNGAHFFVDGPTHGAAAGAIARLLGIDSSVPVGHWLPSFPDTESWATFKQWVEAKLPSEPPDIVNQVRLFEKIADQPEAQRFSTYAGGGGPGAIYEQVRKILCQNLSADPGSVPIVNTYFLHPLAGGCSNRSQLAAIWPTFKRQIDEMVRATGNHPVVYLLELDAFGSSSCMAKVGSLKLWEKYLRYEVDEVRSLPHTVVYLEAGYSDSNPVRYTARALNAAGVRKVRGFFTNDTHMNWTIKEVRWAERISKLTGGAHYIVNTAQNGNGPKLNPHPRYQGVEDLCNPPGRGLGPPDTTVTGFPHADAFLWTHPPGNSSGHCRGGPNSGYFWPARAVQLAAKANARLGPSYPSRPY
jgi:endoglucanase